MEESFFKIIHTSDWHLGQYFMGKSRQAEHQKFLQWLIETATEQGVQAIIVAGDIFDTGSPPSYARQLYNQFIVKLLSNICNSIFVQSAWKVSNEVISGTYDDL